jgi:hypothetical protein
MGVGQQSGPPASPRQLAYLKVLLQRAGHDDFRSARRAYGLTQRQGSGKFTSREASALIDRLTGVEPAGPPEVIGAGVADAGTEPADPLEQTRADLVRGLPAGLLAAELERRGWTVTPP